MMANLDTIIYDIVKKRYPSDSATSRLNQETMISELRDVWSCLNKYISSTLASRRTLNITNFCRFEWHVDSQKPHFSFSEGFKRTFSLSNIMGVIPIRSCIDKGVAEEFNFSKAAAQFSKGLSKSQVFSGLKMIIQGLGESMSNGKSIELVFDCGRLNHKPGMTRFEFSVPFTSSRSSNVNSRFTERSISASASMSASGSMSGSCSDCGSSVSKMSKKKDSKDGAYREALRRHLDELERKAIEVKKNKSDWQNYLINSETILKDEEIKRKELAADNARFLEQQIKWNEEARKQKKSEWVQNASLHNFPKFSEIKPKTDVQTIIRNQLNDQIQKNNAHKEDLRKREKMSEAARAEENMQQLHEINLKELERQNRQKEILAQAWDTEIKIKRIMKTLDKE